MFQFFYTQKHININLCVFEYKKVYIYISHIGLGD